MTQREIILKVINEKGSVTIRDLFPYMNSPSKRLSELRRWLALQGKRLASEDIKTPDTHYSRYWIEEAENG